MSQSDRNIDRAWGLRRSSLLVYLAGAMLVAYLLLLLISTYFAQQNLREAARNKLQNDLEKQTTALSYFYSERRSDLRALADDRALSVYFSNRDLGMSMEYGLRASLLAVEQRFLELISRKTMDAAPIYLRLLFLDEDNQPLIDTGALRGEELPWPSDQLALLKGAGFLFFQGAEHNHTYILLPYHHKERRTGTLAAEINSQAVFARLVQPTESDLTFFLSLLDDKRVIRYEVSDSSAHPNAEYLLGQSYPLHDPQMVAAGSSIPIQGTPFTLSVKSQHNLSDDLLSSHWYLDALILLALLVVTAGLLGIRSYSHGLELQARIDESLRQQLQLQEKNQRLKQEMRKRRDSEAHLRTVMETIPDLIWVKSPGGVYLSCNKKFEQLYGAAEAEIVGRTDYDFVDRELADFFRTNDLTAIESGGPQVNEERLTFASDGHSETLETIKTPLYDSNQRLIGVLGIARDISQRKIDEQRLRLLSQAVEQSPVSIVITDTDGTIEYANHTFERITGYNREEVIGENPRILKSGLTPRVRYTEMWQTIASGNTWEGELQNRRRDGNLIWEHVLIAPVIDDNNRITHYLGMKEDITLQKQQEMQIVHQAHFDNLTDLPNRFLALDRLSQLIKEAQRDRLQAAVLFLDLDDFKKINDTLGHETGDNLLVQAAQRLTDSVRDEDTVARLGGDEFIVLLGGISQISDIQAVTEQILGRFRTPFVMGGRELVLTASIGIAIYPDDGNDSNELLRNADTAMYQSKQDGRNTFHFFTESMNRSAARRLELEDQLRGALIRRELKVFFQPLIDLSSLKVIGVEALLRWYNERLSAVSPDEFIPIAEQTGLIHPIGEFVLQEALYTIAPWRRRFNPEFSVAVNVSPRQFRDINFPDAVQRIITELNIEPQALELEITEGVLMSGHNDTRQALTSMHRLGIGISMDDFGTGYSSLSYLRNYPFSTLKIDRSFINDITIDEADLELVSATISMAHGLGLHVIAEGVETKEQLDLLSALNCDFAQGYYFGKPAPAEEIERMLEKHYPA